jgi:hypothetical protein
MAPNSLDVGGLGDGHLLLKQLHHPGRPYFDCSGPDTPTANKENTEKGSHECLRDKHPYLGAGPGAKGVCGVWRILAMALTDGGLQLCDDPIVPNGPSSGGGELTHTTHRLTTQKHLQTGKIVVGTT